MKSQKDELISGAELARRLDINRSFITNNKNKLKDAKCTYGNKFYYIKSCHLLGRDPDNPHKSRQSELQTEVKAIKKPIEKEEIALDDEIDDDNIGYDDINIESEAKGLLEQILESVKSGNGTENRLKLDILKQKAAVLREYFTAKNEEIKNRKLEENLFERDEVVQILSFAMNMVRNTLLNLPNNYAVNLDGLTQKQIKEYVTDDINKLLEDLQNIGSQFE